MRAIGGHCAKVRHGGGDFASPGNGGRAVDRSGLAHLESRRMRLRAMPRAHCPPANSHLWPIPARRRARRAGAAVASSNIARSIWAISACRPVPQQHVLRGKERMGEHRRWETAICHAVSSRWSLQTFVIPDMSNLHLQRSGGFLRRDTKHRRFRPSAVRTVTASVGIAVNEAVMAGGGRRFDMSRALSNGKTTF